MIRFGMVLRATGAAAALGCLALAGPAAAGGGIRIDSPDNSVDHELSSWGGPEALGFAVLGFDEDTGNSFVDHVQPYGLVGPHGITRNLYISQDGYAGLGPLGGVPSSISTLIGDIFAPALGIIDDGSPITGTIDYMSDATVVTWTKHLATEDRVFQLEFDILSSTQVGVTFNYDCDPGVDDGCPALLDTGFRLGNVVKSYGGLAPDSYYVAYLGYTTSTPEPSTWAMMLLGFGAAGSALRRRRAIAAG